MIICKVTNIECSECAPCCEHRAFKISKAVLVLDFMPANCRECVLSTKKQEEWFCTAFFMKYKIDFNADARASFCPLKEIE